MPFKITSTTDGVVKLYDLRSNKVEKEFKEDSLQDSKSFRTFDISSNEKILSVGTDLIEEDAFILFWDIRGTKLLGGYWECHSDDVTAVKFNPINPNLMASGSVDGLINIFDVSKNKEDDAFTYCLNTAGTVTNLKWEAGNKNQNCLVSVTDSCKVDFWNIEESVPSISFSQNVIAETVKRKVCEETFIISVDTVNDRDPALLVGSGQNAKSDPCVRLLTYNKETKKLLQQSQFIYENSLNKPIVRASLYNQNSNSYITAAEDGSLSLWSNKTMQNTSLKNTINKTKYRTKPY